MTFDRLVTHEPRRVVGLIQHIAIERRVPQPAVVYTMFN